MINFTVGPVQSNESVRSIGAKNTPYFREENFSRVMLENETYMKKLLHASDASRAVFLTGSGTASMEAAVINTLTEQDKALIVCGGTFGERFVELCELHQIPFSVIQLEPGHALTEADLAPFDQQGYTAFLVNLCETSTGVLYDLDLISSFVKRNQLFLIVDAISAFLADEIDMRQCGADIVLTGSQKALAVPPGISIMVLNENALARVEATPTKCFYLDLKSALKNGERGQTPFTPAVTTLLQIHQRLMEIDAIGIEAERNRIAGLAQYFREHIKDFPFQFFAETPSNCVTALYTKDVSAKTIFQILKDEYEIWVCPNGGALADTVFRVGHIGALSVEDYDVLLQALADMKKRQLI